MLALAAAYRVELAIFVAMVNSAVLVVLTLAVFAITDSAIHTLGQILGWDTTAHEFLADLLLLMKTATVVAILSAYFVLETVKIVLGEANWRQIRLLVLELLRELRRRLRRK